MRCWLLIGMALPLAGCGNMSGLDGGSSYACAAPEGVACDSVSGTYANALHHNLPSQRAGAPATASRAAPASPAASQPAGTAPPRPLLQGALPAASDSGGEARPGTALRSPPRVLRLWTKPWEDADGDLWDQGYVYVQIDGGRWQLDHVRQRIRDQYVPLQPPPAATSGASPPPAEAAAPAGPSEPVLEGLSRSLPTSPFGSFPTFPPSPRQPIGLGARQP
jgi:conjugal transfer pilus assembly protein TraV